MIPVPDALYLIVYYGCLALGLWALIDAAIRKSEAYPAVDRQTKPVWLAILAGGLIAQWAFPALGGSLLGVLGMAGIVAAIVYLVDVRKKLIEITRGPRW